MAYWLFLITTVIIWETYQAEIKMNSRNNLKTWDCFIRPETVCMFYCIPECKALTFTSDYGGPNLQRTLGSFVGLRSDSITNKSLCLFEQDYLLSTVSVLRQSWWWFHQMWKNAKSSAISNVIRHFLVLLYYCDRQKMEEVRWSIVKSEKVHMRKMSGLTV